LLHALIGKAQFLRLDHSATPSIAASALACRHLGIAIPAGATHPQRRPISIRSNNTLEMASAIPVHLISSYPPWPIAFSKKKRNFSNHEFSRVSKAFLLENYINNFI
jgi:hypothetical protein